MDLREHLQNMKRELTRASVDVKHPCHTVVFSTITEDYRPQSCWVVFRKTDLERMQLVFFTDIRSQKVKNLKANSHSAVAFYHPKKCYQWRMEGTVRIHHQDNIAEDYFSTYVKNFTDYTGLYAPGRVVHAVEEGWNQDEGPLDQYFSVLRFSVEKWDWLQLSRSGHRRAVYTFDNGLLTDMNWVSP